MIGSKAFGEELRQPEEEARAACRSAARARSPWRRSTSEYQVKRRMPWSSSPRFANGSSDVRLARLPGLARATAGVGAHVALASAQSATHARRCPSSGRTHAVDRRVADLAFHRARVIVGSLLAAFSPSGCGPRTTSAYASGSFGSNVTPSNSVSGLSFGPPCVYAELLHRLFVEVGAHHLLGDARVVGRPSTMPQRRNCVSHHDRVLRLRVVAVALAEDHVVRVLASCGRRRSRSCPAGGRGSAPAGS